MIYKKHQILKPGNPPPPKKTIRKHNTKTRCPLLHIAEQRHEKSAVFTANA